MKAWILIAVMAMAIMAPVSATEAEDELVKWVEENGGQVSPSRRAALARACARGTAAERPVGAPGPRRTGPRTTRAPAAPPLRRLP